MSAPLSSNSPHRHQREHCTQVPAHRAPKLNRIVVKCKQGDKLGRPAIMPETLETEDEGILVVHTERYELGVEDG
jgi:hypothetical protein